MITTENTPLLTLDIDFSPKDTSSALINMIDEKINQCKLDHWIAWEKNHNVDRSETDRKIEALIAKKEELLKVIETENYQNVKVILNK